MDQQYENNRVCVSGVVGQKPIFSHNLFGENFYTTTLLVDRLSGAKDILPVTLSDRLMSLCRIEPELPVVIHGQLRSYNKHVDGGNRLVITVFARSIEAEDGLRACINEIALEGYVCKRPVYRMTPFSREIADLLIAVNRSYNKSDYLPCIAWGRNARFASELEVGSRVRVLGRIQSREYQKSINAEIVSRVAYEVSASSIELL
ncbi:MAG: single-stranded DNA-binding protein [Bacillota bacterium]